MSQPPSVPQRFLSEISRHLTLSFTDIADHPLILGIFGPPGEGKTFQLRAALAALRVHSTTINAADLESDRAGQPGKMLLEHYVVAARDIERGTPTVMVINDIDTTVGEWEKHTGTVNHQQLLAQLMHLADSPAHIPRVGPVRRVPVIVTGNDFTKLYAPLRRPGRMKAIAWLPTIEEKHAVLLTMFAGIATEQTVKELCEHYYRLPVSFFSQLKVEALGMMASTVLRQISNYEEVVRNPARYATYIMAAASADSIDLLKLAADMVRNGDAVHRPYLEQ
ncbi:AAA family ATPase [Dactylosporangium sp. NPDC005572]|uniref:AAA family ATPase n=1 Tax=Dactylosporangium sp. NPDC005572 TaxID=3156889 RepID=UPI0033A6A067